jgi:hypothetical protein
MMKYKKYLRRGIRIAFWSGHSHGRYAGSAWYADNFWLELQKKCVAHVNVDSLGGRGATVLSEAPVMSSARGFASAVIQKIANQKLAGRDLSRAGDQSFIGIGMPSIFMDLSEVPNDAAEKPVALGAAPSGSGWWWHTAEDTPDKIDPKNLVRDTQVYALVALGLCSAKILPFDYRKTTQEIRRTLVSLERIGKGILDLRSLIRQADDLNVGLDRFYRTAKIVRSEHQFKVINDALIELGHTLIPVTHSSRDRFDHEFAIPLPILPCLRDIHRIVKLNKNSDEFKFLRNGLRREVNRVAYALDKAIEVAESASNELKQR